MAPLRSQRAAARANRHQPDTDVLSGMPVRQYIETTITVNSAPPKPTRGGPKKETIWKELPMPKGSEMYPMHCQQLLRQARMPWIPPEDRDEPEEADEDADGDADDTFTVRKWVLVPQGQERPEIKYLADRPATLPPLYGLATGQPPMRKVKVKRLDATGNENFFDVLVPQGVTLEGEVAPAETQAITTEAVVPGTVVEGVGVANAEGVLVAGDTASQMSRKKPPPPKKRKKHGPGRGKKKVMIETPNADGSMEITEAVTPAGPEGAEGEEDDDGEDSEEDDGDDAEASGQTETPTPTPMPMPMPMPAPGSIESTAPLDPPRSPTMELDLAKSPINDPIPAVAVDSVIQPVSEPVISTISTAMSVDVAIASEEPSTAVVEADQVMPTEPVIASAPAPQDIASPAPAAVNETIPSTVSEQATAVATEAEPTTNPVDEAMPQSEQSEEAVPTVVEATSVHESTGPSDSLDAHPAPAPPPQAPMESDVIQETSTVPVPVPSPAAQANTDQLPVTAVDAEPITSTGKADVLGISTNQEPTLETPPAESKLPEPGIDSQSKAEASEPQTTTPLVDTPGMSGATDPPEEPHQTSEGDPQSIESKDLPQVPVEITQDADDVKMTNDADPEHPVEPPTVPDTKSNTPPGEDPSLESAQTAETFEPQKEGEQAVQSMESSTGSKEAEPSVDAVDADEAPIPQAEPAATASIPAPALASTPASAPTEEAATEPPTTSTPSPAPMETSETATTAPTE